MRKMISVLLIASLFCSLCVLSGCGLTDALSNKVPTTYQDADKYTAGNAEFEGTVDTFYVWWLYGSVTIKSHKESTVKIEESANKDLDNTLQLHWRYHNVSDYGNVLYIHYSASGDFDYGDLQKDITVYLPENDAMHISLDIQAASVDVDLSTFENTLEKISVCNHSGKVSVKVDNAEEVRISGQNEDDVPESQREFFFRANGRVDDLGISASYAKVDAAAKTVHKGDVGTVFADLVFAADEAKDLKLSNSRNKIYATVLDFDSLDIETRDDLCELTISPDASFTLTLKEENRFRQKMSPKNVSVGFEDVIQSGKQYTLGTGESKITVATDSDLTVLPQAQGEETLP